MTTITHTLFGIVLAKISMDTGLVPYDPQLIYPFGIMVANAPDIDIFFVHFPKNHRASIAHVPLFWAVLILMCYLFALLLPSTMHIPYIHMLAVGIISHFLFDTFDMSHGIRWLFPFRSTYFDAVPPLKTRPTSKSAFIKAYINHPVMIVESVVLLLVLIAFLKF